MPSFTNSPHAASRPSAYQTVSNRIIASLKAGVIPWEKARKTPHYAGGPFPRNVYICVELAWLEDEDQSQIF